MIAPDPNFFLPAPRLRNVICRLHPHKRGHFHSKGLLDAQSHLTGQVRFRVQQTGEGRGAIP